LAGSKERSLWTNDEEEALREGIQKCVGYRSRGRFATPADFPLHECGPYSHIHVRRDSLGVVHRSWTVFCRPVPNASITIRNLFVAVQANCRTHRPQKLKCLISLCTKPVSILSVLFKPSVKARNPLNRLNAIFVLAADRTAKSSYLFNWSTSFAIGLCMG
jgi:hypothetical protein